MDLIIEWGNTAIGFFAKIDPVLKFALTGLNLLLVWLVFRFNRKMSQSKLSVSPEVIRLKDSPKNKDGQFVTLDSKYFIDTPFEGEGIPIGGHDALPDKVYLKIQNRGDLPSTRVSIILSAKFFKTQITYDPTDTYGISIKKQKRKIHQKNKIVINIEYMGADEERYYELFNLVGEFRESELTLKSIKANGHTYFKEGWLHRFTKPTIIHIYSHPGLNHASDTQDLNAVYGHKHMWAGIEATRNDEM